MTQETLNLWFDRLAIVLQGRKLPCEYVPARECKADEFMLMGIQGDRASFKHRNTRNYVFVDAVPGCSLSLCVPITREPWYRGFFDDYDSAIFHRLSAMVAEEM